MDLGCRFQDIMALKGRGCTRRCARASCRTTMTDAICGRRRRHTFWLGLPCSAFAWGLSAWQRLPSAAMRALEIFLRHALQQARSRLSVC